MLIGTGASSSLADAPPVSFDNDVRPILRANCSSCHGEKVRKADLDLTSPETLLKGGESGAVVTAGKPEESPLYLKVRDHEMPPDGKPPLADQEIETIRRWIAEGAADRHGEGENEKRSAGPTQHDVIPIMLRRCTVCHGLRRQEANLDLGSKAGMLRGGKSGPVIVPGKPEESLLLEKIRTGKMPPPDRLVEASVKPVDPAETEVIAQWIASGAPEVAIEPDVASASGDSLVSDKDRDFWAFRPPQAAPPPAVRNVDQVRNPVDAFVLQKLEDKGLALSPEADRATLLRRASFDLTGMPPEPDEVEAFLADRSPTAYEVLIDRLLASPRHGERWGRHWLDLAGYADSEGKREQDLPRPHAWRYRDYVIQSFNSDKPYDRFLVEQIAGDELADYEHATEITPAMYDQLVATGFLRMAPDATWANITGYASDRLEVIADEMDVLGSAVMGLSLKCARCHSHKFDPIPQRDYYRLLAVFKGAYDEYDWLKPDVRAGLGPVSQDVLPGRLLPYVSTTERRAWESHNGEIQRTIEALRSSLAELKSSADVEAATLESKTKEIQDRIKSLEGQLWPEPKIQALWDRGEPSPTYIYRRGDPLAPGKLVGPGVPSALTDGQTPFQVQPPWPDARPTGRRLTFAKWLARPDHPLTARVMVNRLWQHHFGQGLVKTPGNFGRAGTLPTHPELLDWLAQEFVGRGWSMKAMHRLLMTSATYRQSSHVAPEHETLDPDGALYSRMPLTRLDAESVYDTLLLIAGRLDDACFGPADSVQVRGDGLITPTPSARGWRRLIYVQQMRKRLPTHLEAFDYPQMNPNCLERIDSTVAPQALYLMNNGMIDDLAASFASRIEAEAGTETLRQIERIYLTALGRRTSDQERQSGLSALARLTAQWADHLRSAGLSDGQAAHKALATYCHAVMNSASFLYVD
ncbi:MAG TPA: PSD1 and planctomycete cytochrome C domain-containing protein [Pirellulales bacterium]|nr:PSD1 and planctomycete cytochrome C domain-containing protein [Pirellulales bacterium]